MTTLLSSPSLVRCNQKTKKGEGNVAFVAFFVAMQPKNKKEDDSALLPLLSFLRCN
jgi:hypothetical protein